MFRFLSASTILVFIFCSSAISAGLEKGDSLPATSTPGLNYDDLAAAPEMAELSGVKIRLEAEILQAFDPISFMIKIKAESVLPETCKLNIHPAVHILSSGKIFDTELIHPFRSGPQGTDLVCGITANPGLTLSPVVDLVIRLSDKNGKIHLLRAGPTQVRQRSPEEYLEYSGGNFEGIVKPQERLSSHDLIPIQHDFSGGSSALAALLRFVYAEDVAEKAVMNGMLTHGDMELIKKRKSFSLLDMKAYLKSMGYHSTGLKETDPISYKTFIEDGLNTMLPAIITVDYKGYKHFVLLRGFDENRVYIGDPAFGNISMNFTELDSIMVRIAGGQWMVFVVRKTDFT